MRQVFVLGGLLAVALVGSYITWTAEETAEPKPGETQVYAGDVKDISRVVWTSEKMDVELRPSTDAKGEYVMVHVTERREKSTKPPKPPGEDHGHGDDHPEEGEETPTDPAAPTEGADAPAEVETIVTYFKGNTEAEDLMKSLAPLKALRELEIPADADQTVFGFEKPTATLEVSRAAGAVKVVVGGETFGSKDRYVRLDQHTFLVDDQTLRPLQYGKTRLLERNLQPVAEADVEKVQVVYGDRSSTFTQQKKKDGDQEKSFWADAASPADEHPVAGPWLGKVFKLRVREFVQPEALPTLEPVFRYTVVGKDQSWTVDVSKATVDGKETWYAQADFLRSTVELTASLVTDAVADLESLFPPE